MFLRAGARTRLVPCCARRNSARALALEDTEWVKLACGKRVRVDDLGYRPNVAVVLFNESGKVFTCRRISSSQAQNWQFPQGGIDDEEDPAETAVRELAEETGITSKSLRHVAEHPEWLRYDFDLYTKERLGIEMNSYRGQKQKYFLMQFVGEDSEICLEPEGHTPEFDMFAWVDIEDTPDRVAAFKRQVYQNVAEYFGPLILDALQ